MTYLELPENCAPRIRIGHVGSDLRLRGWERTAISAEGDQTGITETEDGAYAIQSSGDLEVRLPLDAEVTIDNIGSDGKITGVEGTIQINHVGADLVLRKTGAVTVSAVGGDLSLKRVHGDVRVERVGADATLREIEGEIALGRVGADLYVRDVLGACEVGKIGADLVLSTEFLPGAVYSFTAGSDIVCRIAPDADVRFRILDCDDLVIDVPDAEIIEDGEQHEIVFGSGAALVELQAGSEIRFVGKEEDYMMAINFQLEEELEARLSGLEEKLADQLAGLDDLIASSADRLRGRAEREEARALRKAEQAIRRAEKEAVRRAEKQASRGKRKRSFVLSFGGGSSAPRPPRPPSPPREPVTDDERLMILRMVETKQISVEEAERLLAALEGR